MATFPPSRALVILLGAALCSTSCGRREDPAALGPQAPGSPTRVRERTAACAGVVGAPDTSGRAFTPLGNYVGQGGRFASAVGPGPTPGSERLYVTFLYFKDTYELVAIDPATGSFEAYASPIASEYGARAMAAGPDGNMYLGTLPTARFARLDAAGRTLVDLGRPSPTEQFIWSVAFGPDGKLYGGTSPNARLVRYDPATGAVDDLGRMDPLQEFARYIAASKDGFVYLGIGTARMNVVAYRIATGQRTEILPDAYRTVGQAWVYTASDGLVYAWAGPQAFRLEAGAAVAIDAATAPRPAAANQTSDGRVLTLGESTLTILDPASGTMTVRPFQYPGRPLPVFSVTFGPDDRLYGASILPARLLAIDPLAAGVTSLGSLGDGEVYRFVAHGTQLLMATYACAAPLMTFDPRVPFGATAPAPNPGLVTFPGSDPGWRPLAITSGSDGRVYVGAIPGYGKLGGPLLRWDPVTGAVEEHLAVVPDQGISALATAGRFVVGGTTIQGGSGAVPTQTTAELFLWDTVTQTLAFRVAPVPGAEAVENLASSPDGRVYGIAGRRLFVFDVASRTVRLGSELPFPGGTVYGSLGPGPDGRLWGLAGNAAAGVYVIDPAMDEICLVATPPEPITGGFALRGRELVYASGARVYRYTIPDLPPSAPLPAAP